MFESGTLTFRFSLDKVINALAFFAEQGVKDLTTLKAAKLLYLADRHHLLHYGRPITGDRYVAMDLGPVPESAYQLLGRLTERPEVEDDARERALARLDVQRLWRRYPVLRARGPVEMDVFSDSEIEVLTTIVREYGRKKGRELVDVTHEHPAYKRADAGRAPGSSVSLPYEYFFDDAAPAAVAMRELAEREQEDRDFGNELRRAGTAAVAVRSA